MRPAAKSGLLLHESVLLVVVAGEWLFFNSAGHNFGTMDNTFDIVRHSVELGLLALVMTPVILAGGIDLSVGSLLGLCAILFGKFWRDAHFSIWAAGMVTLLAGAFGGTLNALLITRLSLPPLIVTLGTFSLFRGLAEGITRGYDTFTNFPGDFLFLGQERWLGLPAQLPILMVFAAANWVLVHHTTFGRSIRAIGFSSEGARYAGISVERRLALVYVLSGLTAAVASLIYTARLGQAKADAGTGYELLAITAVVLGGTSIFGGVGSVPGTLLGVSAVAVLNNGLVHMRQPREVAGVLTGVLLLAALAGSAFVKKLATARHHWQSHPSAAQNTNTS
jgi:rhamnose transport system permease protein